jgi:hypothetical protein
MSLAYGCFKGKINVFCGFYREIVRASVGLEREREIVSNLCVLWSEGEFKFELKSHF